MTEIERMEPATLVAGARADGHDFALDGLFLGGVGKCKMPPCWKSWLQGR